MTLQYYLLDLQNANLNCFTCITLNLIDRTRLIFKEMPKRNHPKNYQVSRRFFFSKKQVYFNWFYKGAYIKYVGGGPDGFTNFSKNICSLGDHRPKYFMADFMAQ